MAAIGSGMLYLHVLWQRLQMETLMDVRARFSAKLGRGLWLPMVAAALLALFIAPASALAREYSISSVDIDATVLEDGTLRVEESRTFDFDGEFHGVYWDIPTGYNESNGKDVTVDIVSAGESSGSGEEVFSESFSEADGTYEVSDYSSTKRLKIFSAHEDESATFTIVYEAEGIVTRWDDVAELYWKFVSDGWDVMSQNVTCRLHLPVAAGESVVGGDNVRAWGHGPLDGDVAFDGDDMVFTVPGVGTDEYAEMRVTFPTAWVSDLAPTSGDKLSSILSEEQQWADEANSRREAARTAEGAAKGLGVAAAVVTAVAAIAAKRKHDRFVAPKFQDPYFRDVPTADHPAVLGALYNGGAVEPELLTATLMRLTDQGVIRLDKAKRTKKGVFGNKTEDDYLVTKLKDSADPGYVAPVSADDAAAAQKIDKAACRLIFKDVAGGSNKPGDKLLFSRFERMAKDDPEDFDDAWKRWSGVVEGRYTKRFQADALPRKGMATLILLGILDIVLAVVEFLALLVVLDSDLAWCLGVPALLLAVGIPSLIEGATMKEMNREAIEVGAQLEALRRWLREFTRLGEAVPEDVVLWNRLLVMAVVLGVADEVIEQLRVALPNLMDDPYFSPCYGWCYSGYGYGGRPPREAFTRSVDSAHHVSTAALAASSDSSGGGGGGGFSGGGGGGFGGGGGGGAF